MEEPCVPAFWVVEPKRDGACVPWVWFWGWPKPENPDVAGCCCCWVLPKSDPAGCVVLCPKKEFPVCAAGFAPPNSGLLHSKLVSTTSEL